jgi:hypothetical protein
MPIMPAMAIFSGDPESAFIKRMIEQSGPAPASCQLVYEYLPENKKCPAEAGHL